MRIDRELSKLKAGLLMCVLGCSIVSVQADDLQKKLANPVADLITLPFQYNATLNTGPLDKPQHTLNIQPVIPVKFDEWNMINRAIVPILSNPAFTPDQDRKSGMGDVLYQMFFSPADANKPIWGIGPAFMLDTASDDRLGTGKWSAGPTAVALMQEGKWSLGALVTQVWSYAGDDDRDSVSQLQVQPILNYIVDPTWSVGYIGIVTADWHEQRESQKWTVPLGVSLQALTRPQGFVPVNYIAGAGYNVIRPDTGGDWFVRFQVNFILPK
jgi:hypothetical protein